MSSLRYWKGNIFPVCYFIHCKDSEDMMLLEIHCTDQIYVQRLKVCVLCINIYNVLHITGHPESVTSKGIFGFLGQLVNNI